MAVQSQCDPVKGDRLVYARAVLACNNALILFPPVTVMFFRSLNCKQYGSRSDCFGADASEQSDQGSKHLLM